MTCQGTLIQDPLWQHITLTLILLWWHLKHACAVATIAVQMGFVSFIGKVPHVAPPSDAGIFLLARWKTNDCAVRAVILE